MGQKETINEILARAYANQEYERIKRVLEESESTALELINPSDREALMSVVLERAKEYGIEERHIAPILERKVRTGLIPFSSFPVDGRTPYQTRSRLEGRIEKDLQLILEGALFEDVEIKRPLYGRRFVPKKETIKDIFLVSIIISGLSFIFIPYLLYEGTDDISQFFRHPLRRLGEMGQSVDEVISYCVGDRPIMNLTKGWRHSDKSPNYTGNMGIKLGFRYIEDLTPVVGEGIVPYVNTLEEQGLVVSVSHNLTSQESL